MGKKICPICGKPIEEENGICPDCGAVFAMDENKAEPEILTKDAEGENLSDESCDTVGDEACEYEETGEDDGEAYEEDGEYDREDDAPETADKSGKLVKFVAGVLAAILIFFAGKFLWSNFGPGSVISVVGFGIEDLEGTYSDFIYGRYYSFTSKKTTLETGSDADGQASSFDGTYESGFTKDYMNGVLVHQYIIDNNLSEEYEKYLDENDLIIDDYLGFAKKKGITKEQLDAIDQEYQYVHMGESYKTTGYWSYDDKSKIVGIYDGTGVLLTTLSVEREGLVADTGYMTGNAGWGKTFDAKFVGRDEEYGITETICTYNDGNYISTIVQDGGTEPDRVAGTYKTKDGIIVFSLGEEAMRYRKVTGGLASLVYTK